MRWKCKNCGKTAVTNSESAKPTNGICKKDKKRNLEFEDFLISKVVSLVPPVYVPFLQNMACLNHSVKIAFIEHYGLI